MGGASAEPALADAERFGIDPAEVAAALDHGARGVWPDNWPIVTAFLWVDTQWRVSGGPHGRIVVGLDYASVRAGLASVRLRITPELWAGLQVIEAEAIAALNARSE